MTVIGSDGKATPSGVCEPCTTQHCILHHLQVQEVQLPTDQIRLQGGRGRGGGGGRGRGLVTFGFLRMGKDHTHTVQSSDVDNI